MNPDHPEHLDQKISQLENYLHNCQQQLASLSGRFITSLLDNAITSTRISPAERAHWHTALQNDFEVASAELANTQPRLNTTSRTDHLPRINVPQNVGHKQKQILALVNERIRTTGLSYHQAWIETRNEHPELF
jgi:hypothetical protein